jgi:superfamily II RNA helicase
MPAVVAWVDDEAPLNEVIGSSGIFAGSFARVLSRTCELLMQIQEAAENAMGTEALATLARETRAKVMRGSAFLPSMYM